MWSQIIVYDGLRFLKISFPSPSAHTTCKSQKSLFRFTLFPLIERLRAEEQAQRRVLEEQRNAQREVNSGDESVWIRGRIYLSEDVVVGHASFSKYLD